jgi:transcriptional regulator GlxA family with amidase domain
MSIFEEKYQTLVLSIKKNKPEPLPSIDPPTKDAKHPPQRPVKRPASRNMTRTVTLEQVVTTMTLEPARGRLRVGILIFPNVQVLDYCGPSEVFSVTRFIGKAPNAPITSPFQVILVAETLDPIICRGGMEVMPHVDFESCPELDIFIVPGGIGTERLRYYIPTVDFVRVKGKESKILAAVSSGAILLAQAGLLDGRHVATHHKSLDLLETEYGNSVLVERDLQWVQHGKIFTGAEGIDVSLKIVQQIFGETVAKATARHMEHAFPDSNQRLVIDEEQRDSNCELRCSIM